MTVTYSAKVATSNFSCFLKLLLRWRGSIYKLVWKDFAVFATAYYILSFVYRFAMTREQQKVFERIANYCETYNNLIPVAFVLGFFVTLIVGRWWNQFSALPWPDRMALFVTATIQGHDDRGRLMRRTIMRYLCLAFVMMVSAISAAAKKRFPSLQHLTDAGFMLPNEQRIVEEMKTPFNRFFMPLVWATTIVARARKEGRIKDDFAVKTLIDEIASFRGSLALLFHYDWISVPLVYTQVVTLAVYTFFMSCLMGRQFLISSGNTGDMFFPAFTFLQFFFYMGWLKVGESLINPFGEDDDDFDVNTLIDRHLRLSYAIVDEMHSDHPDLVKDHYWDEVTFELPYTAASEPFHNMDPFVGSAANIIIPEADMEFFHTHPVADSIESTPRTDHFDGAAVSSDHRESDPAGKKKHRLEEDVELPPVASASASSFTALKHRDNLRKRNKDDPRRFASSRAINGSSYSSSVDSLRKWWHSRHTRTKQTTHDDDRHPTELMTIGEGGEGRGGVGEREGRIGEEEEREGGKEAVVREGGGRVKWKIGGDSGGSVSIPIELSSGSRPPSAPINMPPPAPPSLGGARRQKKKKRKHVDFVDSCISQSEETSASLPVSSVRGRGGPRTKRNGGESHLEHGRSVTGTNESIKGGEGGCVKAAGGHHHVVGSLTGEVGIGAGKVVEKEEEKVEETNVHCQLIHGILANRSNPCFPAAEVASLSTHGVVVTNDASTPSAALAPTPRAPPPPAAVAIATGEEEEEGVEKQKPEECDATTLHLSAVNLCCSADQVSDYIEAISLMLHLASDAEDAGGRDVGRLPQQKTRGGDATAAAAAAGISLPTIHEADVPDDDDDDDVSDDQSQHGDDDDDLDELQFLFSPSSLFDLGEKKHDL